jgi:hypothetical protein
MPTNYSVFDCNGLTPTGAVFPASGVESIFAQSPQGTCSTVGTAVTAATGLFNPDMTQITVNAVSYTFTYLTPTTGTLGSSAGTQPSTTWSTTQLDWEAALAQLKADAGGAGSQSRSFSQVNNKQVDYDSSAATAGNCDTTGTAVTATSGTFSPNMTQINVNGVNYSFTYLTSTTGTLGASAGSQTGVPWNSVRQLYIITLSNGTAYLVVSNEQFGPYKSAQDYAGEQLVSTIGGGVKVQQNNWLRLITVKAN